MSEAQIARKKSNAQRCAPPRCSETLPEAAAENIPPEKLAGAWQREEKGKALAETLQGCSLYVVGSGARKTAVARLLSRRLPRYSFYDISALMRSTYAAMSKEEVAGLPDLLSKESLENVEQLGSAVLNEVQQLARSVFVAWDGGVSQSDFMVMQQGIVVHLDFGDEAVALPEEGGEKALATWREGYAKADVSVSLKDDTPADDAAFEVVEALQSFIDANPAKSVQWKAKADEALEGSRRL
jgi:hypothetical protein